MIDLSIITVSWNVESILKKCLESLEHAGLALIAPDGTQHGAGLKTQVIIVDSASKDGTVSMIKANFSWVHLIASQENIGFVRGNNLGLKQAEGRLIMLLNPDTEVLGDTLQRLAQVLESDPKIGIVGPHTLNSDGTHQSTRRRFPTFWTGVFESTWLEPYAPKRIIERFRVLEMPDTGTYPVDWVQGSALLAKRELWDTLGSLDERYRMYAEEMDWCKRAKDAGWQVYYVGDAKIIHHSGQSSNQVKARSHVHFQHSKLRYFQKFHGTLPALLLRVVVVLNYAVQMLLEGAKWLLGNKRPLRAERLSAYWLVLRSLLGAGEKIVIKEA